MTKGSRKKLSAREARDLETLQAARELLEAMGWQVELARLLDGRGGHCIVRGQRRVILSSRVPTSERLDVLIEALREQDLDDVFVRPDLRELIAPGSLSEPDEVEPPADPHPPNGSEEVAELSPARARR